MNSPKKEWALSRLLAEWRVVAARDPQFRARVWSRIEAKPAVPGWPGYIRRRALLVAGALALALAVGALTGLGPDRGPNRIGPPWRRHTCMPWTRVG